LGRSVAEVEEMAADEVTAWQAYFALSLEEKKLHGNQGPKISHHGRKQNRPRI
jgi:hypothetical protein